MNEHLPASKIAERLLLRPEGATMDDLIEATGGPQYNVLRRLKARGYLVRTAKEERRTRYFAARPEQSSFEAPISSKGQVTIPAELREALQLDGKQRIRFTLDADGIVTITPARRQLRDLFGILGKPPRSATIEEMEEAIGRAAAERYVRAVGRKRR